MDLVFWEYVALISVNELILLLKGSFDELTPSRNEVQTFFASSVVRKVSFALLQTDVCTSESSILGGIDYVSNIIKFSYVRVSSPRSRLAAPDNLHIIVYAVSQLCPTADRHDQDGE